MTWTSAVGRYCGVLLYKIVDGLALDGLGNLARRHVVGAEGTQPDGRHCGSGV